MLIDVEDVSELLERWHTAPRNGNSFDNKQRDINPCHYIDLFQYHHVATLKMEAQKVAGRGAQNIVILVRDCLDSSLEAIHLIESEEFIDNSYCYLSRKVSPIHRKSLPNKRRDDMYYRGWEVIWRCSTNYYIIARVTMLAESMHILYHTMRAWNSLCEK